MRTLRRTIIALALVLGTLPAGSKVVEVTQPGTLGSLLTADEKMNLDSLTLIGTLSMGDINVVRHMAGLCEALYVYPGNLSILDISKVD